MFSAEAFIVYLIVLLASLVQGSTGFGFGLVAVSLLALFIDPKQASIIIVLASFCMKVNIFFHLRRYFNFKIIWPLMCGVIVSTPIGVWFLAKGDPDTFRLTLGLLVILTVIYNVMPVKKTSVYPPTYVGVLAGMFSGFFHGALNTGGPPLVAYLSASKLDKLVYSAALQFLLLVAVVLRIILLGTGGFFNKEILFQSIFSSFFAILGSTLGVCILKIISNRILVVIINILLIAIAFKYFYEYLF